MEKGQYTALIFIDRKKGIDTVDHANLLKNCRDMVT